MAKIKICGLSRICDIEVVNRDKPDFIGFVFAKSKRQVTPKEALDLKSRLSPEITPVGVFVNESMDGIVSLAQNGVIDAIQLHGDETEEYIEKVKALTGRPVIKAIPVQQTGDVQKWANSCADYLLLDHKGGGTGQSFDWNLIEEINKPFFLAGGLHICNIAAAVQKNNPFAVDISSGVETDGYKDGEKIKAIIRRIRNE